MQHVKLVDGELRQRTAGGAILVPAPGLRRQFQRAFVGEIGFDEGDATQFAGVDFFLDDADAGHQPCAMADGDGDAVLFLQCFDFQAVFEGLRNRLLGIDMFAALGDDFGHRQMLFIRHCQDHALYFRIGQHRLHVRYRGHAHFLGEGITLFLRTAVTGDDLDFV